MAGINSDVRAPKQQRETAAAGAEGSVDERHFSSPSSRRIIEGESCSPGLLSFSPIRRVHASRADSPLVKRTVRPNGAAPLACYCGGKLACDHCCTRCCCCCCCCYSDKMLKSLRFNVNSSSIENDPEKKKTEMETRVRLRLVRFANTFPSHSLACLAAER